MRFRLLCVLLLGASVAGAQNLHVEVTTGAGLGELQEIVYTSASSWDLLSKLYWPYPLGARASVQAGWSDPSWLLRLKLGVVLPLLSGTLIDRDWNIPDGSSGYLWNFESQSPSYTLFQGQARLEGGWRLPPQGDLSSALLLGTRVESFYAESWSAPGGSTKTNTRVDGAQVTTQTLNGLLITYRTLAVIPYVGWEGLLAGMPGLEVALRASPWLWVSGQDFHVVRSLLFFDTALGGFELQPSLALVLPSGGAWDWGVRLTGSWAWGVRGDDVAIPRSDATNSTQYRNVAGSGWLDWQLDLFVRN